MHNKFLFIVCRIIGMVATSAQGNFEIEWNEGPVFLDQFGESANQDYLGRHRSVLKSEILIWNKFYLNDNFSGTLGTGYSNFWNLGFPQGPRTTTSYLPIKLGFNFSFSDSKFLTFAHISNYLLLNKKSESSSYNYPLRRSALIEHKLYTNLELGFDYKISKRTSISLSTPISIFPIISHPKDVTVQNLNQPNLKPFNFWADMWGAALGIKWTLGKVEERAKWSKE